MAGDVLYAAPTSEPITIEEAREHLRVDITDDDVLISSLITAAREYCEKYQNRALITQTRELYLDSWPDASYIELRSPLASVTHIKYYGTDDTEYTMAATDYFVDTKSFVGLVGLGYGKSWPTTTLRSFNGIVVRYVCGVDTVDQMVKAGMLLLIGWMYENREAASEKNFAEVPFGTKVLLGLDRNVPV